MRKGDHVVCIWIVAMFFFASNCMASEEYTLVELNTEDLDSFNNPVLQSYELGQTGRTGDICGTWPLQGARVAQIEVGGLYSDMIFWQVKKHAGERFIYQYVFDGLTTPTGRRIPEPPGGSFLKALPFRGSNGRSRALMYFWSDEEAARPMYGLMDPPSGEKGLMTYSGANRLFKGVLDLQVYGYSQQVNSLTFAASVTGYVDPSGRLFIGGSENHISTGETIPAIIKQRDCFRLARRQQVCAMDKRHIVLGCGIEVQDENMLQLFSVKDRVENCWWVHEPKAVVRATQMFPDWIAFQHSEKASDGGWDALTGKYTICTRDGAKRFELGPLDDSTDVEVLGIFGEDLFVRSDDKIYRADIARETGITNIRLILDGSFPENAHVKVRYAHWVLPKPSDDKPQPKEPPEATEEQNAAPESDPAAAAPVDDAH